MDLKIVEDFIELAKKTGVCELSIEDGDKKIKVRMPGYENQFIHPSTPALSSSSVINQSSAVISSNPSSKDSDLVEVTSPFVGTFYRTPSPDAAPYVKIGDNISIGKPLCIVEAMKIMNEIESEISGEIVEICVENETYVEFGQTLFKVKAA